MRHCSHQVASPVDQARIATTVVRLEDRWRQQYSEHLNVVLRDRTVTTDGVAVVLKQAQMQTGTKAGFIWVAPEADHLALVLITPEGKPVSHRVDVDKRQLLSTAQDLTKAVVNISTAEDRYLPFAQALYQWIVAPLQPTLADRDIDTLIFCLGPGLRTLPLAALHDQNQFLVEQYTIARVPAFVLSDLNYQPFKQAQVLAMGASEFKDQQPLPAVALEIQTIATQLWPGAAFLNQEFTEANLQAQRWRYPFPIIHLATHADFKPGDLSNSYIQLWDARLTLDRMRQLNLDSPPVELLVLSACKTAIGDRQAEMGFAGLAVQAGVRSAVASLWYVSDTGTLGLMTEFYRQLKTAPTKAAALRQAQMAMIRGTLRIENRKLTNLRGGTPLPTDLVVPAGGKFSHPYYWAAFTVVGNPW